ncbi:DUF397 domain-containing protein [Streptomyces sp. NPDC058470]|uniref:DUF397 domain-containing protein n=1 Tax=Streptomyces sp. NPDC058470 TaxID=3346515 RepID=UPI00366365ED
MPADSLSAVDHAWFKSSYSGGNTTECVETAFAPSSVLVRDSKRPESPHLAVSAAAWVRFVAEVHCIAGGLNRSGGELFTERPQELERAELAFQYLSAQALDLESTATLIHRISKES